PLPLELPRALRLAGLPVDRAAADLELPQPLAVLVDDHLDVDVPDRELVVDLEPDRVRHRRSISAERDGPGAAPPARDPAQGLGSGSSTTRSGRRSGSSLATYARTASSIPTSLPAFSERNQRCSRTWWNTSAAGSAVHSSSGTAATVGSNTSCRHCDATTDSGSERPSVRSCASRYRAMSLSIRRAWFSCASSPVRRRRR